MPLERRLQLSMATLASLATLMLGMGERNLLLPLLAALVAFSSIYLTDIKGWLRLNTTLANLAGMVAVAASLWDYQQVENDQQLLALANLLIYLQCVLFYRVKSDRIYWMIALLSLLQVAVSTVLNLSMWFGLLLVVYLFVGLVTLVLFLLHRERTAHQERVAEAPSQSAAVARSRWPLASRRAWFGPRGQAEHPGVPLGIGLARLVLRLGSATILLTAVFFLLVPRTGRSAWGQPSGAIRQTVGFSETVTLGTMGTIAENPEEVLQIRFFDEVTGNAYPLRDVLLLRGAVLTEYSYGQWRRTPQFRYHYQAVGGLPRAQSPRGLVRQVVRIQPLDTRTLFCVHPAYDPYDEGRSNPDLQFDPATGRLQRPRQKNGQVLQYAVLTSGFREGRQVRLTPAARPLHWRALSALRTLTPDGEDDLTLAGVRELAAQIVKDLPPEQVIPRAAAVERYLRDSGRFEYTLSPPPRDPALDPIEDFLFKNPQGHCEYFASAMVLLLRAADIPARLVVGFKGADWNPLGGGYWSVRQLHAHAWVEVYLPPEQLPQGTFVASGGEVPWEWRNGGWLRFDPTPGFDVVPTVKTADSYPSFRQLLDYAESFWSGYVLSMDAKRQREAVFSPLKEISLELRAYLFDADAWRKMLDALVKILRGERPANAAVWFSWRAGLLTMLLLTVLLALYRVGAYVVRRLVRAAQLRAADHRAAGQAEVEFYRRLETLLAAAQISRRAGQTQREFSMAAGGVLAADPRTAPVALLPGGIAEAFYRVRFGQVLLEEREAEAVEQALGELERTLRGAEPPDQGR